METSVTESLKRWLECFTAVLVTVYPLCYTQIYHYLLHNRKAFKVFNLNTRNNVAF